MAGAANPRGSRATAVMAKQKIRDYAEVKARESAVDRIGTQSALILGSAWRKQS